MNLIALQTIVALQCVSVQPLICADCYLDIQFVDGLYDFNDPCFVSPPTIECNLENDACHSYLFVNRTTKFLQFWRKCGEKDKTSFSTSDYDSTRLWVHLEGDKSNCGKPDEMFTIGERVSEEDRGFYEENIVKNWKNSSCVDKSISDDKNDGEDDREKTNPQVDPEVHPDSHPGSEQEVGGQNVGENNSTETTDCEKPDENSGDDSQQPFKATTKVNNEEED
ncbi:hypothetical protein HELRODRAFT_183797 [Helobdella robusta]|uniref:Uncharacterized protein n=1 Tax=Helobdella robusta TaxID=6412 RepID=T1FK74_HELRO|nr:hypothetical protein HELRODRAFT_183797 [Helobdella robusta]ESO10272.1 hypothetical protein HELRODRAFT_183797 [Helobdella robusta]